MYVIALPENFQNANLYETRMQRNKYGWKDAYWWAYKRPGVLKGGKGTYDREVR